MADYIPTNWVAHVTKVTADRMNNLEEGVQLALNSISDEMYGWAQKCLNLLDGTPETYKTTMRKYFRYFLSSPSDPDPDELTALCSDWYALTRDDWCGWVEYYQTDVSSVSTGTAGGDNAGLTCVPSTDTVANQDDYAGLPLFACVDVNAIVDPETLKIKITAIDGITDNFERKDPNTYVGSMQMSGYFARRDDDSTFLDVYSANRNVPYSDIHPLKDAVDPDGSVSEFMVHAKYMSCTVDGKLTSCSGLIPTGFLSHNSIHTLSNANGSQYSGTTSGDDEFLRVMASIKYKSLTLDGILQGCTTNNYQYYTNKGETGVRRVLLTSAQAANLEVGMGVLIGNYTSSGTDRAYLYSITGQAGAIITEISTVTVDGTEYAAVYVDTENTFDTTANGSAVVGTTYLSTYAWPTGTTDGVLGNDGSPTSCTSGKYPAKLQGVEYMNGQYEVIADTILSLYQDTDENYWYEPYVCNQSANQSTGLTANYEATGLKCPQQTATSAAWNYIKKLGHANGTFFPTEIGGSSTTYTRDAFYQSAGGTEGTRTWYARGDLTTGVPNGGLACLHGANALSYSTWNRASRLSFNGNRGEWAA